MKDLLYALAVWVVAGCSAFDYHPYDARFSGETDINAHNIERIERSCLGKDTLHVVFTGDTHGWYSDFEDMVASINSNDSVDFVIHGGDLTDCATTKEFVWCRDVLSGLKVPYVALVGNHDFLGTGDQVYTNMFGAMDFAFIAGRVKFVCINTNATEYNYIAAVPNFDFMEDEMVDEADRFDRTVISMHARPYSDQFNNNVAKSFARYVRLFPGLLFCTNAHDHCLQSSDIYGDGVMYYGTDAVNHRNYLLFTITPEGYEYKVVRF